MKDKGKITYDASKWQKIEAGSLSREQRNNLYGKSTQMKSFPDTNWSISKNHEEYNLEKDSDGNIKGPWPEVIEVYTEITQEGTPECFKCEIEMMVGDEALMCPSCNEKYHVGGDGETLVCVRNDVRMGKIERVDVPDGYMKQRHSTVDYEKKKYVSPKSLGNYKIKLNDDGATTKKSIDISKEMLGKSLLEAYEED